MSILQRCPFCRESIKGSKEKKGPTLGVHFTEVSILKRCLLSVILGLSGLSVTKSQGWGIFPGYCERGPDYLHRKIEPKQILSCLIPRLQFVSTWQLEILVFMQKFCQTHPPSTQPLYPYWDIRPWSSFDTQSCSELWPVIHPMLDPSPPALSSLFFTR